MGVLEDQIGWHNQFTPLEATDSSYGSDYSINDMWASQIAGFNTPVNQSISLPSNAFMFNPGITSQPLVNTFQLFYGWQPQQYMNQQPLYNPQQQFMPNRVQPAPGFVNIEPNNFNNDSPTLSANFGQLLNESSVQDETVLLDAEDKEDKQSAQDDVYVQDIYEPPSGYLGSQRKKKSPYPIPPEQLPEKKHLELVAPSSVIRNINNMFEEMFTNTEPQPFTALSSNDNSVEDHLIDPQLLALDDTFLREMHETLSPGQKAQLDPELFTPQRRVTRSALKNKTHSQPRLLPARRGTGTTDQGSPNPFVIATPTMKRKRGRPPKNAPRPTENAPKSAVSMSSLTAMKQLETSEGGTAGAIKYLTNKLMPCGSIQQQQPRIDPRSPPPPPILELPPKSRSSTTPVILESQASDTSSDNEMYYIGLSQRERDYLEHEQRGPQYDESNILQFFNNQKLQPGRQIAVWLQVHPYSNRKWYKDSKITWCKYRHCRGIEKSSNRRYGVSSEDVRKHCRTIIAGQLQVAIDLNYIPEDTIDKAFLNDAKGKKTYRARNVFECNHSFFHLKCFEQIISIPSLFRCGYLIIDERVLTDQKRLLHPIDEERGRKIVSNAAAPDLGLVKIVKAWMNKCTHDSTFNPAPNTPESLHELLYTEIREERDRKNTKLMSTPIRPTISRSTDEYYANHYAMKDKLFASSQLYESQTLQGSQSENTALKAVRPRRKYRKRSVKMQRRRTTSSVVQRAKRRSTYHSDDDEDSGEASSDDDADADADGEDDDDDVFQPVVTRKRNRAR